MPESTYQMLPKPIAEPTEARMNVNWDDQRTSCVADMRHGCGWELVSQRCPTSVAQSM